MSVIELRNRKEFHHIRFLVAHTSLCRNDKQFIYNYLPVIQDKIFCNSDYPIRFLHCKNKPELVKHSNITLALKQKYLDFYIFLEYGQPFVD